MVVALVRQLKQNNIDAVVCHSSVDADSLLARWYLEGVVDAVWSGDSDLVLCLLVAESARRQSPGFVITSSGANLSRTASVSAGAVVEVVRCSRLLLHEANPARQWGPGMWSSFHLAAYVVLVELLSYCLHGNDGDARSGM